MEAGDRIATSADELAELPTFDLSYSVDDTEDPTVVTVFLAEGDRIVTTWISMEAEYAVDLENVP